MLKMQQYGGLSRVEVRKAKMSLRQAPQAKFSLAWTPVLALTVGLSVVAALLGHDVMAMSLLIVMAGLAVIANLSLRHFFNQFASNDDKVLVVRDGLARLEPVAALVPGDQLIGQAGMVLPVDVWTDQAVDMPKLLKGLLNLVGVTPDADLAIAGSALTTDQTVTVAAVGASRFCLDTLLPALMSRPTIAVIAGLQVGLRVLFAPIAFVVAHIASHRTPVDPQTQNDNDFDSDTLVGHVRHAATLSAFQYNQDPVSWTSR
ncbi:hypothetical protein [Lacticaseibacillus porcinae]|uniref:hypothetical protein n=1 Tax=Lacticaseibacillus porcinae TaxID=1123687 RepID=UPI000F7A167C|nr:hypothetical protein [Lacticaseibacillus porcinae]